MNWSANLTTRAPCDLRRERKFITCAEWMSTEKGCFRRVILKTLWVFGFRPTNYRLKMVNCGCGSAESGLMFQCGKRLRCRLCLNFVCGQGWLLCPSAI